MVILLVATASLGEASTDDDILHNYLKFQAETKKAEEISLMQMKAMKTPTPQEALVQEATQEVKSLHKFPTWVETEADLEAYFKQQGTKVVRKNTATHLAVKKNAGTKAVPATEFVDLPAWVHTEDDMEKFFKQQGTKVVRTGGGEHAQVKKAAAPKVKKATVPELSLVQGLEFDPMEVADHAEIMKGLKEAADDEHNTKTPYVPSLRKKLAALDADIDSDGAAEKNKEELSYDDSNDDFFD